MKKKIIFLILIFVLLITCSVKKKNIKNDYFPDDEWRTSTPEMQGMDSEYLFNMINEIKDTKDGIHSILIIRNGYLVMDANFYPFTKDELHPIYSCTKSVASALAGIAIDQGKIKSINEKVLDYFPEYKDKLDNYDKRKKNITIKHLLTMTSGISWFENDKNKLEFFRSPDWAKYMLDKSMSSTPGKFNNYNSGNSYLLSVILQKSIGTSLLQYANENLFSILNIKDTKWKESPQGIHSGGWGIFLKPSDMAKFGYLYLKEGNWDGKQIIPKKWIKESVKNHIDAATWGTGMGYGYSWWIIKDLPFKCYQAIGMCGQHIIIIPELDMVVVFTGENPKAPYKYFSEYILKAVKSNSSINENKQINEELDNLLFKIKKPIITEIEDFPEISKKISGKTYEISGKNFLYNRLTLNFDDKENVFISLSKNGSETVKYFIGMNGVYRNTKISNNDFIFAYNVYKITEQSINCKIKGYWKDENTLIINSYLDEAFMNKLTILLKDNNINIVINNTHGNYFLIGQIID